MAIHSIIIQNFKGIGPRVKIDLKPVTLLFGPNSAGKSTILHAIHYIHAILETGNPDVDYTFLGGQVDLGGFANLVHDHDLKNEVVVGIEYVPDPEEVDERIDWYCLNPSEPLCSSFVDSICVTLHVKWSPLLEKPIVYRYEVEIDGDSLAEIACSLDGANVWLTNLNLANPFTSEYSREATFEALAEFEGKPIDQIREDYADMILDEEIYCLPGRKMALPYWDRDLGLDRPEHDEGENDEVIKPVAALMVAAGFLLKKELERFRYIGPIRQTPPRTYTGQKYSDESMWANGLGAWEWLVRDKLLRKETSKWLGGEQYLNTGYRIKWRQFRELDDEIFYRLLFAAQNYELDEKFTGLTADLPVKGRMVIEDKHKNIELAPCDLGQGITQVVPVVAAALARTVVTPSGEEVEAGLIAIEQPELHIHPRMQVVLGDLFLSQCNERQFLIETHSEHVMLRLLRRIRETAEKELPAGAPEASIDTVAVYYVEPVDGTMKVAELRLSKDGEFLDSWPQGFFDERFEELY